MPGGLTARGSRWHDRALLGGVVSAVLAVPVAGAALAHAAVTERAPSPLSAENARPVVESSHGSGIFGRWGRDKFGLPVYDYSINQREDKRAANKELEDSEIRKDPTDAWHLVGNENIAGFGVNHGYSLLFSTGDEPEYTNWYDAEKRHYSGGFGYLKVDGDVVSTLTDDAPQGAKRRFGAGYYERRMESHELEIDEQVYAPFGSYPGLRHDVTVRNTSQRTRDVTWWEYWDVNPVQVANGHSPRGLEPPTWDPATRTLKVAQRPDDQDTWTTTPSSIFLSALSTNVEGYETEAGTFFGDGTRAKPAAVTADSASNSTAPGAATGDGGSTMFAMRSPIHLDPGASVTLRYLYGEAPPDKIDPLVAELQPIADPFERNQQQWFEYLPHIEIPGADSWVAREMTWHAYMTRALVLWQGYCGRHVLDEDGHYMFGSGGNVGATQYLQSALLYGAPELSRETIRFWAEMQEDSPLGQMYYTSGANCEYLHFPAVDNLDLAFIYAVVQYVFATRDFAFLDEQVKWNGGGTGALWDHVKLAHQHMETVVGRGAHELYNMQSGDFSDLLGVTEGVTESMDATAFAAFIHPLLAEVADRRGDTTFAKEVRATGERNLGIVRREWTGRWYSRGYAGLRQLGSGALYVVPQGWAMLAGGPDKEQAETLIKNYERFILGIGAPPSLNGPSKFGSPIGPARADPDVTERSPGLLFSGDSAADYDGVWWEVNGPLIWGFASLDAVIGDRAHQFAWDLYKLNSQGTHATVFPEHWAGVLTADDRCSPWYAGTTGTTTDPRPTTDFDPASCGIAFFKNSMGFNAYEHAFMSWDSYTLAGIQGTVSGWVIHPRLPFDEYAFRTPGVGISVERNLMRGYFRTEQSGSAKLEVVVPPRATDPVEAWVGSTRVASTRTGGRLVFDLPLTAGQPTDWAITWGVPAAEEKENATACVATRGFSAASATPSRRGLRFGFARAGKAPVRVDLFQVSKGRRVVRQWLVGRFTARKPFTWQGRPVFRNRKITDGDYFVRMAVKTPTGGYDGRRIALVRRHGRWSHQKPFYRRETCGRLRSFKLLRPVFGGARRAGLGISYRLERNDRVRITIRRGRRVVRRYERTNVPALTTIRHRLSPRGLRKGLYSATIVVGGGKDALRAKLYAKRI